MKHRFQTYLCYGAVSLGLMILGASTAQAADARQGAALLKTDVMAVLAHPDDETGMAAALATMALLEERVVTNVYCTRGEGGGNMVGTQWGPSLGILREAELRDCLDTLGVRYCFFLDQRDWAYTESMAATLRAWDRGLALERLVRYVRALRPEVMLTMNPTPNPGQHGHHQSAAILATEAFVAAADPDRFPEQITTEGLSVWQARKLYYTGSLSEHGVEVSGTREVGGRAISEIVGDALSEHRSQGFGRMRGAPWLSRPRWFTLAKSTLPFAREASFFEGLPLAESIPALVDPPRRQKAEKRQVSARLIPRPAIVRYEDWVREWGVEQVAVEFTPDVPVVVNRPNQVLLELSNESGVAAEVEVSISGSSGVSIQPLTLRRAVDPGRSQLPLTIVPDSLGDHEIVIKTTHDSEVIESKAKLHAVPFAEVPMLASAPTLATVEKTMANAASLSITPAQRVQGRTESPNDSSAVVKVGTFGGRLEVDIRVWDETIVENIMPNDVRGHWRSDSVEICVDPAAGAEDSFSCYKIGIFPFVGANRQAAAARDADARQGPIAVTAPGTRVVSQAEEGGYRILASIPFSEIGEQVETGRFLGFNVIVYDGDKADAAPGENINESRLAWSPRSGVQGRPEDWGRILLR